MSTVKEDFLPLIEAGQRVCIDMQWDDVMHEKEVKSLVVQLAHLYGFNRRSDHPLNLFLTSVDKRARECLAKISGFDQWLLSSRQEHYSQVFPDSSELIYLTAESPNVLKELDKSKVYIIGGMVDHNRHKRMCHNKAVEAGIATAR